MEEEEEEGGHQAHDAARTYLFVLVNTVEP